MGGKSVQDLSFPVVEQLVGSSGASVDLELRYNPTGLSAMLAEVEVATTEEANLNSPAPAGSVTFVSITRPALTASFGFGLGTAESGEKIISNVTEGSLAAGQLQTGDVIVSANGTPLADLSHEAAVGILKGRTNERVS